MDRQRRRVLELGGIAAATALAGCSSLVAGSGDVTPTETPADTETATATATPGDTDVDYGEWFAETDNFDGTVDARGRDALSVTVGAPGNSGGAFAFDPPAVHVDPGTTVTWEWTGNGASHNVVADNGAFRSGDPTGEAGHTFAFTFDSQGLFKYFCDPHRGLGMRGAVVVGDPTAGGEGGGDTSQYDWQAATFDSYWYSLYNMSTNIAMSGNGVLFPHNDRQREQFEQRIEGIAAAADVDEPPIRNPNLNMAPFTTGDPQFTQQPVFDAGDGRPDASTLAWDTSRSSGVVSPASLAWTHLKGVTWAKNFQKHFDILPPELAPKFRAQVLATLAQIGTNATLIAGGPDGTGALTKGESLKLVSGFRPADGTVVDETARPTHHAAMLWFLSDLTSLAQHGWFGYVNPEPLIPAPKIQQLADGMAKTTMELFAPSDIVDMGSTRDLGQMLGAVGYYGAQAGSSQRASMAADYANGLADAVASATDGNGRVGNGATNQAATQGIAAQGLLWASQLDGVDRRDLAGTVVGYLFDELWDGDASTFATAPDAATYTITARDAGDITGGLNAADAVLGTAGVKERFAQFFDATFNTGGLQRAQRPPSVSDRDDEPPLPPNAGGEFGQAAVYNAAVEYDTERGSWSVADDTFRTADALYLANQDIWVGNWAGDFYQGRGVPGQSDSPPN